MEYREHGGTVAMWADRRRQIRRKAGHFEQWDIFDCNNTLHYTIEETEEMIAKEHTDLWLIKVCATRCIGPRQRVLGVCGRSRKAGSLMCCTTGVDGSAIGILRIAGRRPRGGRRARVLYADPPPPPRNWHQSAGPSAPKALKANFS